MRRSTGALAGSLVLLGVGVFAVVAPWQYDPEAGIAAWVSSILGVVFVMYVLSAWLVASKRAGRGGGIASVALATLVGIASAAGALDSMAFLLGSHASELRCGLPSFAAAILGFVSLLCLLSVAALEAHRYVARRAATR